jgi:hypothetical protein
MALNGPEVWRHSCLFTGSKRTLRAAKKRLQRVCDVPRPDHVHRKEIGREGGIRTRGTVTRNGFRVLMVGETARGHGYRLMSLTSPRKGSWLTTIYRTQGGFKAFALKWMQVSARATAMRALRSRPLSRS